METPFVKGFFHACWRNEQGTYDLLLSNDGDAVVISGLSEEEITGPFYEAGDSLFVKIRLFEEEPAPAGANT